MDFLEPLNQSLFLLINADPASPGWRIQAGLFVANRLILLVPIVLAALWLWGAQAQRDLVLKALVGIGAALCISYLCGALWPHPRPFVLGLGQAFFAHKATSSFPSNHTIIIATLAFTLIFDRRWAGWGYATLLLAAVVGLSRVYLGVHFPLDIAGGLLLAPVAAGLAVPVWRRVGAPLTAMSQAIYRRLLALPIARGWIRA
ncbi:phosphatase PAP2 family protein [Achromobacter ruhlandii]|uniref:Phosphatase PAP2 family protein n=1 Tax=Achromobacter ruhlandii TaxID=72557 RepID=A0A2M9H2G2_9BURK|nr:phosphatase PAP2 family protein [Achromobacter ruhlandii]ALX85841.1 UDP pyrophosphate phosphatase [Achromobacter denitrificans]AMG45170.1 undecaprenyl-diphosphatase [Achromobacter xylosoxidans]MCV6797841.1 phosphatase PAP2 family protein [Achromobacter ruhlandii]MCV6806339.1 phosphatase PAP2 family protein [Achromobacter ruhlandii]MCV6810916.1 phosphatase PAP2 family protein [Achromobacter ruhlandii]